MDGSAINATAALIAAVVAGIIALGNFWMQIMAWRDARDLKRKVIIIEAKGDLRASRIEHLSTQVNGRLSELKIRIAKEAFEMGRKFQQESPEAVSLEFPKPKVEELMEQIINRSPGDNDKTIG